ncbi:MAG: PAS domain S-box protein [Candidatus Hodarchaeota archaeon]
MSLELLLTREDIPIDAKKIVAEALTELKSLKNTVVSKTKPPLSLISWFQAALEQTPDPVAMFDLNLHILWINPAWTTVLGYTLETLQEVLDKICPADLLNVQKTLQNLQKGDIAAVNDVLVRLETENRIYISLKMDFQRLVVAERVSIMIRAHAISETRRTVPFLHETETLFQTIVENSFDLISIVDLSARHLYGNPKWHQVLGYTVETLGDPFQKVHPDDRAKTLEIPERIQRDGAFPNLEYRIQTAQGHQIILESSFRLIQIGNEQVVVVTSRDITQRKQAEEQLKRIKRQEERYYTMLSHFLSNDLHKVLISLECIQTQHNLVPDVIRDLDETITLTISSSKTIETVNKIFTVLQTPPAMYDQVYNLFEVINDLIAQFQNQISFRVNQNSLNVNLSCHRYIRDAFSELIAFSIGASMNEKCREEIVIQAHHLPQGFYVSIQDNFSPPIPRDVCIRLENPITDQWEAQGLFIGLALASVVMQHAGGKLIIQPRAPRGNNFQLMFPPGLLQI